jgi:Xaa-Pro dipeptidase
MVICVQQGYQRRHSALIEVMQRHDVGLTILAPGVNMFYFSGFYEEPSERPMLCFLPVNDEPFFYVPELYYEHVSSSTWIRKILSWKDGENSLDKIKQLISKFTNGKIAFDGPMRLDWLLPVLDTSVLPRMVVADEIIKPLREIKSDDEIGLIRRAGELACKAFDKCIGDIRPGLTEREFAALLERTMVEIGGSSPAFRSIVATGANSSMPHYRAGNTIIERGRPLVIDFGVNYKFYNSDMTRTVFIGEPSGDFKEIYSSVAEAQELGISLVNHGSEARMIDLKVRDYLSLKGLSKYFIHRTGHGIGLEVHENPYINSSNTETLATGMCFSVEPGVYLQAKFGVRIEDIVVVGRNSAEILTPYTRELIAI